MLSLPDGRSSKTYNTKLILIEWLNDELSIFDENAHRSNSSCPYGENQKWRMTKAEYQQQKVFELRLCERATRVSAMEITRDDDSW